MNNYAVSLHCEDLEITQDGKKDFYGLFITIRVESETESEAGNRAIEFLKSEPILAEAFSERARKSPKIVVAVVHQLPFTNKMKNTPFDFFLMSEQPNKA